MCSLHNILYFQRGKGDEFAAGKCQEKCLIESVYIHGSLRQIKQTGDFSPFGNVSVVTVGVFFQLPPVKGKPLYVDDVGSNLWSSLFCVVELTGVVRQKDQVFAELLNRVRTHSKRTPMLESDIETLKRCEATL